MRYLFLALFLNLFFILLIFVNGRAFFERTQASIDNTSEKTFNLQINENNLESLSLEKIFQEDHSWVKLYPEEKLRKIIVTGDVLLARSVNVKTTETKNFKWPFAKTADVLREADITYINLETPLTKDCAPTHQGMIFCGDPRNIDGLIFAGVDVANIANNHIYDQGDEGAVETQGLLSDSKIIPVGLSGLAVKEVDDVKFGFLGYTDLSNYNERETLKEEIVKKEIVEAKLTTDVVIVQFHWGNEYTTEISKRQRDLAYLAIDNGADLIIGNHPHWIQPIEIYKEKLIAYSHGNFIFDQEWSRNTKLGVVGKYIFYEDELIDVEYLPIKIQDYGQPYFLSGKEKQSVLENLKTDSINLSSQYR